MPPKTASGTAGDPLPGQTATHIAAGSGYTCAILSNKTIRCWGRATRSPLTRGEHATHIAAGSSHTCAILDDDGDITNGGSVKCWGSNGYGQTGGGTSTSNRSNRLTLSGTEGVPLTHGGTAIAIAAGNGHTCAILTDKSVKCWGRNYEGQTGGAFPLGYDTAEAIAAGEKHTCAIMSDNTVKCWGTQIYNKAVPLHPTLINKLFL